MFRPLTLSLLVLVGLFSFNTTSFATDRVYQKYLKAAEQGDVQAQFRIGFMYSRGLSSLEKDDALAAEWYEKSAKQGYSLALFYLGGAYSAGKGVEQDLIKSHMYHSLSIRMGAGANKSPLKKLRKKLSPEDILTAEKMAKIYSKTWSQKQLETINVRFEIFKCHYDLLHRARQLVKLN